LFSIGFGTSIITVSRCITAFCTSRFFLEILAALGEDGGYWLFAGFCFIGMIYVMVFIPETKGKTLEEIQAQYIKKKSIPQL